MFEHPNFDIYQIDDIPLDRDSLLMDEIYLDEYEKFMLRVMEGSPYETPPGYISRIAVREINSAGLELSWFLVHERFHEIRVTLPREEIVICVGCWRWSEDPRIFVKSGWLDSLHLNKYSVFGFIDAIGMKDAIRNGVVKRERLIWLRDGIDQLANSHPEASFISFADSVLIKSNWSVGMVGSDVRYTYQPETLLTIAKEFQGIFRDALGLPVYAIFTQGHNVYYDDSLLHVSASQNHISLNSLGLPFARLLAIDEAAKSNIRAGHHPPADLYMDEHFFRSLRLKFEFMREDDHLGKYAYHDKMSSSIPLYRAARLQEIIDNVDSSSSITDSGSSSDQTEQDPACND